jgi:hypothetical protein
MKKEEQRFLIEYFWMGSWGSQKIHEELVTIRGVNACGRSQINVLLQKYRKGNFSCKEAPRTGRPPLTSGRKLQHFFNNILWPVPGHWHNTS